MVNLREYLISWGGIVDGTTVLYQLQSAASADIPRTTLNTFLGNISDQLHPGVDWDIEQEGRVIDSETGQLVETWFHNQAYIGTGLSTGPGPVAQATQVYLRHNTGTIRDGRRLAGGTYIPGLDRENLSDNGELLGASQLDFTGAANPAFAGVAGFVVWGRPRVVDGVNQNDGVYGVITSSTCRGELATQRPRRRA